MRSWRDTKQEGLSSRILFGTESRSRRQHVVVRWLIKKKGRLLPSVTATVAYAAANDCARVGDLIKSTRDKFERRILGGDENVYILVISPFRGFLREIARRRTVD